jgi:hypothetical protein
LRIVAGSFPLGAMAALHRRRRCSPPLRFAWRRRLIGALALA